MLGAIALAIVAGVSYFAIGLGPETDAIAAVEADDGTTVEWTDAGYVVYTDRVAISDGADDGGDDGHGASGGDEGDANSGDESNDPAIQFAEGTAGVVLYPGARVNPESYVPTAAAIAEERDVVVVIPEVPLNLAILAPDRADRAIETYPEIDRWYVGGHSLGGVAACRYAADDPDRIAGLMLLASYCDRDLSGTELPVLSILGTNDGVIDVAAEREARGLLPADARIVEIDGMNHAQFGAYGPQRGDDPATIDDREARATVASTVGEWLLD